MVYKTPGADYSELATILVIITAYQRKCLVGVIDDFMGRTITVPAVDEPMGCHHRRVVVRVWNSAPRRLYLKTAGEVRSLIIGSKSGFWNILDKHQLHNAVFLIVQGVLSPRYERFPIRRMPPTAESTLAPRGCPRGIRVSCAGVECAPVGMNLSRGVL